MSDSYPHIAGSCTAHRCVSNTAALTERARGAGSNGQATGGAGASGAQRREVPEYQDALERIRRKGPRGQTDQRKIQRMRRKHTARLAYDDEKTRGCVVA